MLGMAQVGQKHDFNQKQSPVAKSSILSCSFSCRVATKCGRMLLSCYKQPKQAKSKISTKSSLLQLRVACSSFIFSCRDAKKCGRMLLSCYKWPKQARSMILTKSSLLQQRVACLAVVLAAGMLLRGIGCYFYATNVPSRSDRLF